MSTTTTINTKNETMANTPTLLTLPIEIQERILELSLPDPFDADAPKFNYSYCHAIDALMGSCLCLRDVLLPILRRARASFITLAADLDSQRTLLTTKRDQNEPFAHEYSTFGQHVPDMDQYVVWNQLNSKVWDLAETWQQVSDVLAMVGKKIACLEWVS
jgi:hypothetical protein